MLGFLSPSISRSTLKKKKTALLFTLTEEYITENLIIVYYFMKKVYFCNKGYLLRELMRFLTEDGNRSAMKILFSRFILFRVRVCKNTQVTKNISFNIIICVDFIFVDTVHYTFTGSMMSFSN